MALLIATTVLNSIDAPTTRSFSIFIIVCFVACTITSFGCLIYCASKIKDITVSKGVSVTGLVFSIVGLFLGLIFCIACFAAMAALSSNYY